MYRDYYTLIITIRTRIVLGGHFIVCNKLKQRLTLQLQFDYF